MAKIMNVIKIQAFLWLFVVKEIIACKESLDEENCAFIAVCKGVISLSDFVDPNPMYNRRQLHLCFYSNTVHMPIPLHVTVTNVDVERPLIYDSQYEEHITTLNLTFNSIETMPTIPSLDSLTLLNVSHCNLKTVQLSNAGNLRSLIYLDLSHNVISSINSEINEYMFSNLQTLNLSHNSLEFISDAIFSQLTELTSLDLSYNYINQINMLAFEGVKQLKYLNISNNRIIDINGALFRFIKLIELNLSNNKITKIYRKDIEKLNRLEKLDLHFNLISTIETHSFWNSIFLTYLDLGHNKLNVIERETFRNTSSLHYIELSYNQIKNLEIDLFKMKEINYFNIKHNHLQGSLVQGMFEGLVYVTELDLSHQNLTSLEDFAFIGLDKLTALFINNNNLSILSKNCFSNTNNLETLDLSSNNLTKIDFNKENLLNLKSIQLRNNKITRVFENSFEHLNRLQFIDLSGNSIVTIEVLAFKHLRDLIGLEVSRNPLQGELTGQTFNGLSSLPTLDISNTQLTAIRNLSFDGMEALKILNISHSSLKDINYNAFRQTGSIEILDLSHNELKLFIVNATDFYNLKELILSFNLIEKIYSASFKGFVQITALYLNNNMISSIEENALEDLKNLTKLDISFNTKHVFSLSTVRKLTALESLYISDLSPTVSFNGYDNLTLNFLQITGSNLPEIKSLKIISCKHLETIRLTNDKITNVSAMDFIGLKSIKTIDLSFNNINFIQPGSFKDNYQLYSLNISHNTLPKIGFGVLRGLISLHTIDISYNNIDNLQMEAFTELINLKTLIADHNRIKSLDASDLLDSNLDTLSIGDNPIPCEILSNLEKSRQSLKITAIIKNEYSDENIKGVSCNFDKHLPSAIIPYNTTNDKILLNIRDILYNMSIKEVQNGRNLENNNTSLLKNLNEQLNEINNGMRSINPKIETQNNIDYLKNTTDLLSNLVNISNVFFPKIVKLLALSNSIKTVPPVILAKENSSFESIMSYVSKLKTELENKYEIDQHNIDERINSLEKKIESNLKTASSLTTKEILPSLEKPSEQKSLIFTEVCVFLILFIVICFAVVNIYRSRLFMNRQRSISTRQIVEPMDNSNL